MREYRLPVQGSLPRSLTMTQVRDAMQREPRWCFDDEPIDKAADRMRAAHLKCMPVVDRTLRLVGMLSIEDLPVFDEPAYERRRESS